MWGSGVNGAGVTQRNEEEEGRKGRKEDSPHARRELIIISLETNIKTNHLSSVQTDSTTRCSFDHFQPKRKGTYECPTSFDLLLEH